MIVSTEAEATARACQVWGGPIVVVRRFARQVWGGPIGVGCRRAWWDVTIGDGTTHWLSDAGVPLCHRCCYQIARQVDNP